MVNVPILHSYPFAWEGAVMTPDGDIAYDTPLTNDVVVFDTDEEANAWLEEAFEWGELDKTRGWRYLWKYGAMRKWLSKLWSK